MNPPDVRSAAVELRERGDYGAAGNKYTSAGYAELAEGDFHIGMQGDRLGTGLYCFLAAALCYRLAAAPERCRIRCEEGILIATEYRDHVVDERALVGLLYEIEGDFQIVGGIDDGSAAYEHAAKIYADDVSRHYNWAAEPIFDWNAKFFEELAAAAEWPIEDEAHLYSRLDQRVRYKRDTFADRVDAVVAGGYW